jgi:hypothetical protein
MGTRGGGGGAGGFRANPEKNTITLDFRKGKLNIYDFSETNILFPESNCFLANHL